MNPSPVPSMHAPRRQTTLLLRGAVLLLSVMAAGAGDVFAAEAADPEVRVAAGPDPAGDRQSPPVAAEANAPNHTDRRAAKPAIEAESAGDGGTAAAEGADRPAIQTIGEDLKIHVVDHDGKWSMHAENVGTNEIVRLWHIAGGPEVTTKVLVDRPFTLSVHALSTEAILERLYEGYGFTMHYDDAGRLDTVRVYSMSGASAYKTPRLTETLSRWKEIESGDGDSGAAESGAHP